jgi:hypothetical protein
MNGPVQNNSENQEPIEKEENQPEERHSEQLGQYASRVDGGITSIMTSEENEPEPAAVEP